jgi:acetylornithine/succinyldiaminopimelate/putrescine aminotransferase
METDIFYNHHLAQTTMYPFALEIAKADGVYLYDTAGKSYLDFISGVGVSNIGHGNRQVIDAMKAQMDQHLHVMVYGEFLQSAQSRAAQRLAALLPPSLDCCYFVNSGTEANEAALKLAKRVTGRYKLISFRGAYHGSTHGSLSVSGNETKKRAFRPLLPGVEFITFNEISQLTAIDHQTAGIIVETIQGDAGIRIPSAEFMLALRQRCTETGAQLILDEIQCGMGRTGSLFAFEQFGIQPDILTLGKALGGGMPVGCFVSSREKMQLLTHNPMLGHISTFAGHPVICAAVDATLEFIERHVQWEDIQQKGFRIAERLRSHPAVREIRHRGYFFAIDLEDSDKVQRVVERCLQNGLIAFWFLSCPASFRIAPPLTLSEEEMEAGLSIIIEALSH